MTRPAPRPSRRPLAALAAVALLGLAAIALTGFLVRRNRTESLPLLEGTHRIELNIALAHLWCEEWLAGDTGVPPEEVWRLLDAAEVEARALLAGGEAGGAVHRPVREAELRELLVQLPPLLEEFRGIVAARLAAEGPARQDARLERSNDEVFDRLLRLGGAVHAGAAAAIDRRLALFRGLLLGLALAVVLSASLAGLAGAREERRRARHLGALEESNAELEEANRRQVEAERDLQASNSQLSAVEQQLRASNQQLRASNQQLRAGELALQQALEETRAERARAEAVLAAIGDGLSIQDRDYRVIFQNEALRALLGDRTGELCYRAYEGRDEVCEGCPVRLSFADGRVHTVERGLGEGTAARRFEITTSPLRDGRGEIVAGIEVVREVTERHRALEERLRMQRLESLGILAGGIAHDFNNLLTAILANVSFAGAALPAGGPLAERLGEAERACLRARDLTRQLLTFARGGLPQMQAVALEPLLRELAAFALRGSPVRGEFRFAAGLHPVRVDEGQMGQAVGNLVLNAVQAMPGGGVVEVEAENVSVEGGEAAGGAAPGEYVQVTVRDGGTGIPPEVVGRIFDPYFTTKERGSGLGLAVTHSIVASHGGQIAVASVPGEGTTVTLLLPAAVGADAAPAQEPQPAAGGGSGRVLVMDDEEVIRSVAAEILAVGGFEAVSATDGGEAVRLYRRSLEEGRPFAAVVLDLTVPGGMGGMVAAGQILALDPDARLVVSSGYSDDPVLADPARHGFLGVASKPYRAQDLIAVIRGVLRSG